MQFKHFFILFYRALQRDFKWVLRCKDFFTFAYYEIVSIQTKFIMYHVQRRGRINDECVSLLRIIF